MTIRAAVYTRQSLDRTGEGAAVARQLADCRTLAEQRSWTITHELSDNDISASGRKPRPAYQELLALIRAGQLDRVVVWHVDRLTRRLVDLEEVISACEASSTRLATVTGDLDLSTDTGRMLARILASVARGEVERKGTRQRAANRQRAEKGQILWTRRPFGYDRDGSKIRTVPAEAKVIRAAAKKVLAGASIASVVVHWNSDGIRTTADGRWSTTSVRRVLLNPRYSGRAVYNGEDFGRGAWPVILKTDVQQALEDKLLDPRRRTQASTTVKYLLSGLAVCGRCGDRMFASPMGVKGDRWQVYRCRTSHLMRRQDLVDEVVIGVVLARLARPDAAALLSTDVDLDGLRAEVVDLRDRRDGLAALAADGLLPVAKVREQAKRLTDQITDIEQRMEGAVGSSPVSVLVDAQDVQKAWGGMTLLQQRDAINALMTVTILPSGKGVRFDPEHVQVEWREG